MHVEKSMTEPVMTTLGHVEYLPGQYRVHQRVGGKELHFDYTNEQLGTYDSRIPSVLNVLFDSTIACRKYVPLAWLHNTLSYMDNPIHIEDIFHSKYVVKEITKVSFFEDDRKSVTISVTQYNYFCLEPKPYITDSSETFITVSCDELDKYYPGWLIRYDVLMSLSMGKTDFLARVFQSPSATVNIQIANLTFD